MHPARRDPCYHRHTCFDVFSISSPKEAKRSQEYKSTRGVLIYGVGGTSPDNGAFNGAGLPLM